MSDETDEAKASARRALAGLETAAAQVGTAQRIIEGVSRGDGEAIVSSSVSGGVKGARGALHALGVDEPQVDAVLGSIGAVTEAFEGLGRGVHEIVRMVERARAVEHAVRFAFSTATEPEGRWLVRDFTMSEPLGRPYRARITLTNEDLDALPETLLGASASMRWSRGERSRWVHGIVARVEHGDRNDRAMTVVVELVPALAALGHGVQSRIFQDKTASEILRDFLSARLAPYEREATVDVPTELPRREYCVQFQETDLAFVHRLLEEEGLTYYFEHPDGAGASEHLVVADATEAYPAAPLDGEHALYVAHRGGDVPEADPVFDLRADERIGVTDVVVSDFDWTRGGRPDVADGARSSNDEEPIARESYEQDGRVVHSQYSKDSRAYGANDLLRQAKLRRDAHRVERLTFRGLGASIGFVSGRTFRLLGHPDAALDREYVLVDVEHRGRDARIAHERREDRGEGPIDYECSFRCTWTKSTFRLPRETPKPRIHGVQTAIVCGPEKDDIWTDEHGRIRIQFHWDGAGQLDESSTCWVRCVQQWAGEAHGAMWIPRVGSEVAVTFLDGDPDRPLVIGSLYSGKNPPWQAMPESKTRSGWRTRSSVRGDGYNELSFEDAQGNEEVYVRAERNLREEVLHDHTTHVRHCQTNVVDVDQREHVGRDQALRVEQDRKKRVQRHERNVVVGTRTSKIHESDVVKVKLDQAIKVHERRWLSVGHLETEHFHGGRQCQVKLEDRLEVIEGANRNVHVTGQHNITADERFHVQHRDSQVHLHDDRIFARSPRSVTLEAGDACPAPARIRMAGGEVRIEAERRITFVVGETFLAIENGRITLHAPSEVVLRTSNSSYVKVGGNYAQVKSTNVDVAAEALATLSGSLVKLN